MPDFTGVLRPNEIFASLYNMIISQEVFSRNIVGTGSSLVDAARTDGGLYGDTKLYYSTDALKSRKWLGDLEATNLLAVNRPVDPKTQAIHLDVFRQIDITVDYYLSKRAWMNEGAFSAFTGVTLGWIRETKRIYDSTTYNAFIGTHVTTIGNQSFSVNLGTGDVEAATVADIEASNRLRAQKIALAIANLFVVLTKKPTRLYNDYGHIRSYDLSDLVVVWNSKYVNEITKIDLPTMFHKDNLISKFDEEMLDSEYFGSVNAAETTITSANVGTVRSLVEQEYEVDGDTYHAFAGEPFVVGAILPAGTTYTIDNKVICKIMFKGSRSVPFMSAFEVGTSFFNPRSLTENHYLTWGHNTLEHIKDKPFITIKEA